MIVLINSPLFKEKNLLYDEDSLPPIGLGYIATHLQNNNIEVQLIDAVHERIPLGDLIAALNYLKPNFIASNIFTTNCELVRELIESIKFKTHLIIGGLSTKELYKDIINYKTANHIDVVIGDGELITLDIINNCLKEDPYLIQTNRRVFKVFGNSKYFVGEISDVPLNRSFFLNEPAINIHGVPEANIIASRGCIYNCKFCAASRALNRETPTRERTSSSVRKELQEIKQKYKKVKSVRVLDDLFLKHSGSIEHAIEVFNNLGLKWRSMAHVMTFSKADEVILKNLKKSGCTELFVGIESGSPKILKEINKTSNRSTIIRNLTKVLKAGIDMKGYFIYGFPEETAEDMQMTYELAAELKKISKRCKAHFRTSVFQYRPYHATEIYHDLKDQGHYIDVSNVAPDKTLSDLVGRIQFNFHSGNYSKVDISAVHDYIYRTLNLNDEGLYAGIKHNPQSKKRKKL